MERNGGTDIQPRAGKREAGQGEWEFDRLRQKGGKLRQEINEIVPVPLYSQQPLDW